MLPTIEYKVVTSSFEYINLVFNNLSKLIFTSLKIFASSSLNFSILSSKLNELPPAYNSALSNSSK